MIEVNIRLFNSLSRYGARVLSLPEASTVADALEHLRLPEPKVYMSLLNGRSIMTGPGGHIERQHVLRDGDTLAFSGPVPFSRGYGAPII